MLREYLEHLLTPCPRPWKAMGYLREQIAIDARLERNRAAWAPHLEATRREIAAAAERCRKRRCVLVLGAGVHNDLPLAELASRFDRVVLADLVHRPAGRRAARRMGAGIHCVEFDASGVAAWFHAEAAAATVEDMVRAVAEARIGLPAACEGEPDLVVSANLCSQLLLLPIGWVERGRDLQVEETAGLHGAAAQRHVRWLEERTGEVLMIADLERRRLSPKGGVISSEPVAGMQRIRRPDTDWVWRIAPIPESSRRHHVEHRVGAWRATPLLAG